MDRDIPRQVSEKALVLITGPVSLTTHSKTTQSLERNVRNVWKYQDTISCRWKLALGQVPYGWIYRVSTCMFMYKDKSVPGMTTAGYDFGFW